MNSVLKYLFVFICFILITYISGCGEESEDNQTYSESGSAMFRVVWPDDASNQSITRAKRNPTIDCEEKEITEVAVDVYDGSPDRYLTGNTFSCSDGEGTVDGILPGADRLFKFSGMDENDNVVYEGEIGEIEIIAGQETNVGAVKMKRMNNTIPTVTIESPSEDNTVYVEGNTIAFTGTGEDVEDGILDADVLVWASDQIGPIGTGTYFSRDDLPIGTHLITLTATDDDNAISTSSITISISKKENKLPTANINQPAGTYDFGDLITFEGTGDDPEDITLSGSYLKWETSIDGLIGEGTTFSRNNLSPGTHTITLTVTDKNGGVDTETVTITVSNRFENSIGMEFRVISPGTFTMGSPPDEPGRDEDETQHNVTLTRSYCIQTTEVTQKQWKTIIKANRSFFPECGEDCPVENVTWYDCVIFCNRLSQEEGLIPSYYSNSSYTIVFNGAPPVTSGTVYWKQDANGYRLPTEAEWEYAARAGSTTAFANGPISETGSNFDRILDAIGYYCGNSDVTYEPCFQASNFGGPNCAGTHPVAQKNANAWGLYDMHGNVSEYCQDWLGSYPSGTVTDPEGPSTGSFRVKRGGDWISFAKYSRSACRDFMLPDTGGFNTGFRLLLLPGQ